MRRGTDAQGETYSWNGKGPAVSRRAFVASGGRDRQAAALPKDAVGTSEMVFRTWLAIW
jgi:hypothetical protein